ncbi:MAG TPA: spore protein P [Verrucomicrobiae bacterium]|nr:spore protein P [Verrucomicrobiae bacterium]
MSKAGRSDSLVVSSLSKEELEELYSKYGRPGEVAPGVPGQRRRTFPRPAPTAEKTT